MSCGNPPRPGSVPVKTFFFLYRSILSPALHTLSPSRCRYLPTCSEYAEIAVLRFGLLKGGWLALRRLARCHPWSAGGLDVVPPAPGQTP